MHIVFVIAAILHSHKSDVRLEKANPSEPVIEVVAEPKDTSVDVKSKTPKIIG